MNCRQFDSKLNKILDQRGDPRCHGALQQHAAHCPQCRLSLKYYAAFNELVSQPVATKPVLTIPQKAYASLILAAVLALVLLLPVGTIWFDNENEPVNLAKAGWQSKPHFSNLQTPTANTLPTTRSNFWQHPRLTRLMSIDNFPLPVPGLSDLEQVGQSIHSAWATIRSDKYFLPILKQSALFWAP